MENAIYFDGATQNNPGPSAFAFTHFKNKKEAYWECGFIGNTTNNVAEYTACLKALLYCKSNNISNVEILGDSMLVIKQIKGEWRIKCNNLKKLHESCLSLKDSNITFTWIPRENNVRADYLSRIPLRSNDMA